MSIFVHSDVHQHLMNEETESISDASETKHEFDDFDNGGLEADATTANINVNYRF